MTTEQKWTPGPWSHGIRKDGSIWLSIGDHKTGPHYQADLCASEEDAKLICAAPAMYEALEKAFGDLDSLLDYVAESNAIRMVGGREAHARASKTLDEISAVLAALKEPHQ